MAKRRGKRSRRQRRILNPHRKIQQVIEGADFIKSMPDEILNHILSFIPIDLAIRTSVLSRRWRHAWCELPCLHLRTTGKGIDQTLLSYRRLKIMSFKLRVTHKVTEPQFNSWVEFAMSRNTIVLKMLAKLQNVERLTFCGGYLLQILSLAMLCGVRLPKLKVQSLTVQTNFARSVIPSIARLLQNSPGLKKLEVHATYVSYITDADLDAYLRISQGLDSDTCWRSKHEVFPTTSRMYSMSDCNDALKLLDSFLRLVLRNAKRLEKIVVRLGDSYFSDEQRERLLMVGTLSPNNNVSIEFK
uniref:F-box domain-containing protein n=1 Tax=Brassica oleracea var. oleracea TaxID=109376 RepID=A0A0D3D2Y3_BRAOL